MIAWPTEIPIVPPSDRMRRNADVLVAMSFRGIAACNPISGVCEICVDTIVGCVAR